MVTLENFLKLNEHLNITVEDGDGVVIGNYGRNSIDDYKRSEVTHIDIENANTLRVSIKDTLSAKTDTLRILSSNAAKRFVSAIMAEFEEDIHTSIGCTKTYDDRKLSRTPDPMFFNAANEYQIVVENLDTVSAAMKYSKEILDPNNPLCVLNFASFTAPGGGFITGAMAQEESICYASTLYPVLKDFDRIFYKQNKLIYYNKGLYANRALYSQSILFGKQIINGDNYIKASVLSAAAPNRTQAKYKGKISEKENLDALTSRIEFVLDIMEKEHVAIPILGAFGCGVFGQDPKVVAKIFADTLKRKDYHFKKVVFAIIAGADNNTNYEAFKEVFGKGQ